MHFSFFSARLYRLVIIFALFLTPAIANAQSSKGGKEEILYSREYTAGVNFNTNGGLIGGGMLKHARSISARWYHNFYLEVVNVKHRKEQQVINPFNGSSFSVAKQNHFFTVRPMYGREYVLFKKARDQGVQVNIIAAAGPALGFEVPYHVTIQDQRGTFVSVPYVPVQASPRQVSYRGVNADIVGSGSFTDGFSSASILPGISLKMAMSFEFGVIKSNVMGFETGLTLDAYTRRAEILAFAENRSFYPSVFLTFYFGTRS